MHLACHSPQPTAWCCDARRCLLLAGMGTLREALLEQEHDGAAIYQTISAVCCVVYCLQDHPLCCACMGRSGRCSQQHQHSAGAPHAAAADVYRQCTAGDVRPAAAADWQHCGT